MPLGGDLALQIEQLLAADLRNQTHDGPISTALMRDGGYSPEHAKVMARIRDGIQSCDSIDDFISEWSEVKDIERIAKLCIAYLVLQAESASSLWPVSQNLSEAAEGLRGLRASWLSIIGRKLNPLSRRRDLAKVYADCAFVTFNYDRCIQQYLLASFMSTFNRSREDAMALVSNIPIYHAYGSLGDIADPTCNVEFGAKDWMVGFAARGIRTYTENAPSEDVMRIRDVIRTAEKIVFLGCAFHGQNLDLLFGEDRTLTDAQMFGTVVGMAGRPLNEAKKALSELTNSWVLEDLTCGELLRAHDESIF